MIITVSVFTRRSQQESHQVSAAMSMGTSIPPCYGRTDWKKDVQGYYYVAIDWHPFQVYVLFQSTSQDQRKSIREVRWALISSRLVQDWV